LEARRRTQDSIAPPTVSRLLLLLLVPPLPPKAKALLPAPAPLWPLEGPKCAEADRPAERRRWGGGSSEKGGRRWDVVVVVFVDDDDEEPRGSEVMARLGRCLATKAFRPSCAGPGLLTFFPASVPTPPGPERT
jgi:hypothetical protein